MVLLFKFLPIRSFVRSNTLQSSRIFVHNIVFHAELSTRSSDCHKNSYSCFRFRFCFFHDVNIKSFIFIVLNSLGVFVVLFRRILNKNVTRMLVVIVLGICV